MLVRYGQNFRGVKELVAQEHGAAGVLIYSDPHDDGWQRGDKYPQGPWRPDTGVQRGSVGYMFEFPGDPTTPGIASVSVFTGLAAHASGKVRAAAENSGDPDFLCGCVADSRTFGGSGFSARLAGGFAIHLSRWPGAGEGRVAAKAGFSIPYYLGCCADEFRGATCQTNGWWLGNHRDAWVYGAVDPNSGTVGDAGSLCTVLAELLKSGWKPKRTMIFASWDAEEEGLIGSTEWGEQHAAELANAAAYFNVDVAVSGPKFGASSVPTLKQFIRDVTKAVPSPKGGTVYEVWKKDNGEATRANPQETAGSNFRAPAAEALADAPVGDLGSGSDYTVFLQHLGVPSTDMGSTGAYGVYHSVFDNFNWFKRFGDPDFLYEQQMARVFGLEAIRMANADVLPYDYLTYGKEIGTYIEAAKKKSEAEFGGQAPSLDGAIAAAKKFEQAGGKIGDRQRKLTGDDAS